MESRCPFCRDHSPEAGGNLHGLRREKHRGISRSQRELVLLVIGGDKLVEAKFHHRYVQQVGGAHRLGQPMFAGEFGDSIEHFVVVHFEKAKLARLQMLLKERQARLILRHRQQRPARCVAEPSLASGDMENLNLVEAGQQGWRIVLLEQGESRRRIGFRPVELEEKSAVEIRPQNRSSLSWASNSVAVGPEAGPSGKCCCQCAG